MNTSRLLCIIGPIGVLITVVALAAPVSAEARWGLVGEETPSEGYTCSGNTDSVPAEYRGAYKAACTTAAKDGIGSVRKMMTAMKRSMSAKCDASAPEGKRFDIGCKPCHSGAGKAGNTSADGIKKAEGCDKSLLVDK